MWPMAIGFVCTLVVVGMMRHVFVMSALDTPAEGLMGGFGIGAFLVTPWLVMCYAYSMRSRALMIIDGAYYMGGWVGGVCTPSRTMMMSGRTLWHAPDASGRGAANFDPEQAQEDHRQGGY